MLRYTPIFRRRAILSGEGPTVCHRAPPYVGDSPAIHLCASFYTEKAFIDSGNCLCVQFVLLLRYLPGAVCCRLAATLTILARKLPQNRSTPVKPAQEDTKTQDLRKKIKKPTRRHGGAEARSNKIKQLSSSAPRRHSVSALIS